jgi:hypothetical protein
MCMRDVLSELTLYWLQSFVYSLLTVHVHWIKLFSTKTCSNFVDLSTVFWLCLFSRLVKKVTLFFCFPPGFERGTYWSPLLLQSGRTSTEEEVDCSWWLHGDSFSEGMHMFYVYNFCLMLSYGALHSLTC